jgi:hypothetical protein
MKKLFILILVLFTGPIFAQLPTLPIDVTETVDTAEIERAASARALRNLNRPPAKGMILITAQGPNGPIGPYWAFPNRVGLGSGGGTGDVTQEELTASQNAAQNYADLRKAEAVDSARVFAAPKDTIYVLASGQSNMLGSCPADEKPDAVFSEIWDGTAWVKSSLSISSQYSPQGNNNIAHSFILNAEKHGYFVRLIIQADGGEPIAEWQGAGTVQFDSIQGKFNDSGMPPADVFLWHQGENDAGSLTYESDFLSLLSFFRSADFLKDNAISIVGETFVASAPLSAIRSLSSQDVGKIGVVSATGLTSCDGVHFDGKSIDKLGSLYFNSWVNKKSLPGFTGRPKSIPYYFNNGRLTTDDKLFFDNGLRVAGDTYNTLVVKPYNGQSGVFIGQQSSEPAISFYNDSFEEIFKIKGVANGPPDIQAGRLSLASPIQSVPGGFSLYVNGKIRQEVISSSVYEVIGNGETILQYGSAGNATSALFTIKQPSFSSTVNLFAAGTSSSVLGNAMLIDGNRYVHINRLNPIIPAVGLLGYSGNGDNIIVPVDFADIPGDNMGNANAGGQKVTNMAEGTNTTDAMTYGQLNERIDPGVQIQTGNAIPEGSITANPGTVYISIVAGTARLWLKEFGTGNTGWREK